MKLSTFKKAFGRSIQQYRMQKNLTQSELAERLNIDISTLGKLECGMNFVSAKLLLKICSALEVAPAELLNFGNIIKINTAYDDVIENILELLLECDNEKLKHIYKIIIAVLEIKK